jgi:hypothetical protein
METTLELPPGRGDSDNANVPSTASADDREAR